MNTLGEQILAVAKQYLGPAAPQFLTKELPGLARGAYAHERLTVPTRLLAGTEDVAVKGSSLAGANADDLEVHWIDGVGHFLPDEAPEHVVQHARELL